MKMCFLLSFLLLVACTGEEEKIATEFLPTDAPTNQLWDMELTKSDSGRVSSIIQAGYVAKYERSDDYATYLDSGVVVTFYNLKTGEQTSVLTAKRGKINDQSNDMEAFENVRVVNNDSTILITEYLKWVEATQLISSDQYVEIIKPNQVLRGYGFESDRAIKNYRIFRVAGEAEVQN